MAVVVFLKFVEFVGGFIGRELTQGGPAATKMVLTAETLRAQRRK